MTRPMDAHAHFRVGEILKSVVPATARHFDIAVAMPNLVPPIKSAGHCRAYCDQLVMAAADVNPHFRPLGICYLTDNLSPDILREGWAGGSGTRVFHAAKYYPAGATTNSDDGVTNIKHIYPTLEVMQEIGMPILFHGEVPETNGHPIESWNRERVFVETILRDVLEKFPTLRIVLEHVSTKEGIEMILSEESGWLAGTITPHHLLHYAHDLTQGGFHSHLYCMPIVKGEADMKALLGAMRSGDRRFFAGTDTAPHLRSKKESACCAAGAFVAPRALEAYALAFGESEFNTHDGVARFERFMSFNGPAFYGIPHSKRTLKMVHTDGLGLIDMNDFLVEEDGFSDHLVPFFSQESMMYPKGFKFPWEVSKPV
jgi:dihydroorotase